MFRPIAITAVLNGWIVTVGCQTLVYSDRSLLVDELSAYLRDPDATADRLLKSAVNVKHTMGGEPVPHPPPTTWSTPFPDSPVGVGLSCEDAERRYREGYQSRSNVAQGGEAPTMNQVQTGAPWPSGGAVGSSQYQDRPQGR